MGTFLTKAFSRPWAVVAIAVIATASLSAWWLWRPGRSQVSEHQVSSREQDKKTTFVGEQACGRCHQSQVKAFAGSHHERAMAPAGPDSVRAPFAGETFSHDGTETTFFRRDADFVVRTVGQDGAHAEFKVAATFGVEPLQQYLLETSHGRLQAFTVAWDTRREAEGGQRYFSLYPNHILTPSHPLFWAGPAQNWNFMCADCHATAFEKRFDASTQHFSSTSVVDHVSCEACHGPASQHTQHQGNAGFPQSLTRLKPWRIEPGEPSARPRADTSNRNEVSRCAPCHSRRTQLRDALPQPSALLDSYAPDLITEGLYHADGQIDDEVYVYGSFLQSRMYAAGVRCSDCHDPHSLKLRRQGNDLCASCHRASEFDTPKHHHHQKSGSACVDCHMPSKTYMQVDERRDHAIRVPDPELSQQVGAPDACTGCHQERSQTWAAQQIHRWRGGKARRARREQTYGRALHAARSGQAGAQQALANVAADVSMPDIVRASALAAHANRSLAPAPSESAAADPESAELAALFTQAAREKNDLVRLGVAIGAAGLSPTLRSEVLQPLVGDARLAVRVQAARALVELSLSEPTSDSRSFALSPTVLQELENVERYSADRADSWLRLSMIELARGQPDAARRALQQALKLNPSFVPALVNLADLERQLGQNEQVRSLLERATQAAPDNAGAWHALGLAQVRTRNLKAALESLARAVSLEPSNARFCYVLAVALSDTGDLARAKRVLREGLTHAPNDPQLRSLLTQLE